MPRKLKIDDVEYEATVIPPYLLPFLNFYGELAARKVASVEEAEKAAEDMRRASEKILSACVNPRPRPEHEAEIFRFVSGITNEAIRKVDDMFFPQRPGDSPSGRIRAVDKGKTKQDFGS